MIAGFVEPQLSPVLVEEAYRHMFSARIIEETMIKMSKSGEGHFWIGGPGEESFNVALGLNAKVGHGPKYDYFHLHYRSLAVAIAMGAKPIDSLRQMAMKATDPYSGGRNFCNHICIKEKNILPVTSTIETQFSSSIGTGIVQSRSVDNGITVVIGGDAGTAEGDFASCLYWASNQSRPLPILIIVTNNMYGISTPISDVWGEERPILNRAKGFGIPAVSCNGNDFWHSYDTISKAMEYVRTERKPFFIETVVSRLYGHSSSSGANRVEEEDCLEVMKRKMLEKKLAKAELFDEIEEEIRAQVASDLDKVRKEPDPTSESAYHNLFAE